MSGLAATRRAADRHLRRRSVPFSSAARTAGNCSPADSQTSKPPESVMNKRLLARIGRRPPSGAARSSDRETSRAAIAISVKRPRGVSHLRINRCQRFDFGHREKLRPGSSVPPPATWKVKWFSSCHVTLPTRGCPWVPSSVSRSLAYADLPFSSRGLPLSMTFHVNGPSFWMFSLMVVSLAGLATHVPARS